MGDLGKLFVGFGCLLVVVGLVLMLGSHFRLPIGRLPGDIVYRGKNSTVYFPIVTSILLSILLSLVLYVIGRISR